MTDEKGYVLRAADFGDGQCRALAEDAAIAALGHHEGLIWLHVTVDDRDAGRQLLQNRLGFHPLEVEDALSPYERPTLRAEEDTIFLVTTAVVLGQETERFVDAAFFVNKTFLVSVTTEPLGTLEHWFDQCLVKPRATGHSPALLLHSLVDAVVDGYFPAVDLLGDQIDALEEAIFAGKKVNIGEALALKRRLLEMRRQVTPIRDILNGLLRRDQIFVDEDARVYFQDVYDHTLRITEVIDMERDILSSVLDAHLSITSNNLNQVMRSMTVISTLLMTAAFVAGVYGMNFKVMPELEWAYGYPFAYGLMGVLCAAELWIFRRVGWI